MRQGLPIFLTGNPLCQVFLSLGNGQKPAMPGDP
jgi:hypothetical protein